MAVDSNFNKVSLLLKCDGTNASTAFPDSSPSPKTVTAFGNAQVSTAQSKFGGASAAFDGTGDYLSFSNSAVAFGTRDFTIEGWLNVQSPATSSYPYILCSSIYNANGGFYVTVDGSGTGWAGSGVLHFNGVPTYGAALQSTSVVRGAGWKHFAITRQGPVTRLFINGTKEAEHTAAGTANYTGNCGLIGVGATSGGGADVTYSEAMYLDDFRVTDGVARYTGNFTPPTISHPATDADSSYDSVVLHLPCDGANASTAFPDTKGHVVTANGNAQIATAQSKWGGASAAFDGTGDYLSVPSSSDFAFGTGDGTIEFWARFTSVAAITSLVDLRSAAADTTPVIYVAAGGALKYHTNNADRIVGATLTTNTWYHIAWCRASGVSKLYLDGVQTGSDYTDSNNYVQYGIRAGAAWDGLSGLSGYLDDIRITKGVARYTGNFTPPAGPFPTTGIDADFASNVLLLHGEGANGSTYVEDASPTTKTVTCNGNAAISTAQAKWGAASIAFDGTGDYLAIASDAAFGFVMGDFTFECRAFTAAKNTVIFDTRTGASDAGVFIISGTTGRIGYYDPTTGGLSGSTTDVTDSAWHHLAWVRSGGAFYMFVDGAIEYSGAMSQNMGAARPFRIGAAYDGSAGFNGYLDDIRITKGVARYTANFTPALGAFPDSPPLLVTNPGIERIRQCYDIPAQVVPLHHLYL